MNTDYRVRMTKRLLEDSLIKAMRKKSIDKITVKEICASAGVNRSTFYLHYADIYDLLEDVEDRFYSTVYTSLQKCPNSADAIPAGYNEGIFKALTENFRILIDNRGLVSAIFGEFGDPKFRDRVIDVDRERCINRWKRINPNIPQEDMNYVYLFFAHGGFAIARRWVMNGMKDNVEHISALIYALTDVVDNYVIREWKEIPN